MIRNILISPLDKSSCCSKRGVQPPPFYENGCKRNNTMQYAKYN
nr:MAG TPA: hypothetical protein [Caudoviricetes sp.]